jgi:mannosyltransferase
VKRTQPRLNRFYYLIVVILIGFALRLFRLGAQSLWYDEGVSWYVATMPPLQAIRWTAADIQPPLYYLLQWGWIRLAGQSEFALRYLSAIFGLLVIPLMWLLGKHVFRSLKAENIAACLAAVSPLVVYYSQEARMYTLLLCQGALSCWLFWRLLEEEEIEGRPWPDALRRGWPFILVSAAGLYIHYFSLFLLLAQGLYALLRRGLRPWRQWLVVFGLIPLLYIPWLPFLLQRFREDASYWQGVLKVDEAVRHLAITYTTGETVLEQQALWLSAVAAVVLLLIVFVLLAAAVIQKPGVGLSIWKAQRGDLCNALVFCLLWLVVPLTLFLVLGYRSPKFNPRYAIQGWLPAALLLSAGLYKFWSFRRLSRFFRTFSVIVILFFLASSAYSLFNWYTDPAFTKTDFRGIARYVRAHIQPEETVILTSGHIFPVWAYYYGWSGWHALPRMETLDVNNAVTFANSAELKDMLNGKSGAWLVNWQDEVIDPNGVVPLLLDSVGRREATPVFWGARLFHWRLNAGQELALTPPIAHEMNINFGNQVTLLGFSQPNDDQVIFYWQARQPLSQDYRLNAEVIDENRSKRGQMEGNYRLAAYLYPPWRWSLQEVVPGRHQLAWEKGTPAGDYSLRLKVTGAQGDLDILDAQGNPQGRQTVIGPLALKTPRLERLASVNKAAQFQGLILSDASINSLNLEPGELARLSMLWSRGDGELPEKMNLFWRFTDNKLVTIPLFDQSSSALFFDQLEPGFGLRSEHLIRLPNYAAAGPAAVWIGSDEKNARMLFQLQVLPSRRIFAPPPLSQKIDADFSGLLRLLGYSFVEDSPIRASSGRCQASRGQCAIHFVLFWQALAEMDVNYTVFLHLLDDQQKVVMNLDHGLNKEAPKLMADEIIADPLEVTFPASLPPGLYHLEIGLYNSTAPGLPRLSLSNKEDRVILFNIEVVP